MKKIAALALLLVLTACGGAPAPAEATPSTSPSPTVTVATEKQLASIIAGFEHEARETLDGAAGCRARWVLGDWDDPVESAAMMVCFSREVTLGVRAKSAADELEALTPPEPMADLVRETVGALRRAGNNLEADCGLEMTKMSRTSECRMALAYRFQAYAPLNTVLAKWKPYL